MSFKRGDTVIYDDYPENKSFFSRREGLGQCVIFYNYNGIIAATCEERKLLSTRSLLTEKGFWVLIPKYKRTIKNYKEIVRA